MTAGLIITIKRKKGKADKFYIDDCMEEEFAMNRHHLTILLNKGYKIECHEIAFMYESFIHHDNHKEAYFGTLGKFMFTQ